MRLFRLVLCIFTLLLAVNIVGAQNNPNPFTPPGAVPLGDIGFDEAVKIPFPFDARFYLKLTSQSEGFISVQFEADKEMTTPPSVYMLNSDAAVLNSYSSSTQGERVTALFGVYGKPPYYIIFNRPVALSVTVFEGDRVRHRRVDIEPEERIEGQYEPSGEAVYHQLEGVQANDIVTFYLDNDRGNVQLFNGQGQFLNRATAYCHLRNSGISSYRLVGDPPYTVQMASRSPDGSWEPYRLTIKIGNYIHEPVNLASLNTPISLQVRDEGLCETVTFKPPHSGDYVISSDGELDPRFFVQLVTDSNDDQIANLDYKRNTHHAAARYHFETTDFVHILISNTSSITFSISDNTEAIQIEVIHVKAGDGPVALIQTDSSKSQRYEIIGEKGDLVFIKTLYDINDPYCYTVLSDRNKLPLYPYQYRYDFSSINTASIWSVFILGNNHTYSFFSKDTCLYIFQVFKAGTFVTYDDLEKSFAPLIPWRPPSFNS